jgi:trehalose 6-phosphate phosphatase
MPDDPLRLLAAEPERAAVLLDVDGTLAPIAARPEDAHVPEETRGELARLVARYALVACVSGRPRSEVERMVRVAGVAVVGEHGLELAPEAAEWAGRIADFARGVDWPAERKPLSVSFHFRRADDEAAARVYLTRVAAAAEAEGLVPRWGRMVLEVRPPVDAHKGTAVVRSSLVPARAAALYAGDDRTDLDAFGGLDGLELGVRVAVRSPRRRRAARGGRRGRGRHGRHARAPAAALTARDYALTKRTVVLGPPTLLDLGVVVLGDRRADGQDLEPVVARLGTAPDAGRDADEVALGEIDDVVADLHPPAATDDDVHLLLVSVRVPERHSEPGGEDLARHAERAAAERLPGKASLEARREAESHGSVVDVLEVEVRVCRHRPRS